MGARDQGVNQSEANQVIHDPASVVREKMDQWAQGTWKFYTESKGWNCDSTPANSTMQECGPHLATPSDFSRDTENLEFCVSGCERHFPILKCWPLIKIKTNSMN